ncbi:MAG: glucosidase [Anaerolineales bacterium]|nr:glucosidase [Anaerolineales bacterium]
MWRKWGSYLAERAWGTVREDYSADGDAWDYFPHDHARSRVYRWNEDGLGGISDDGGRLCFALALWNGRDPILKERFFGLSNPEGNHGEDVKECYYYLDNTPCHSSMKMLYKYPHAAFPYAQLIAENRRRGADAPEYELIDTGVFAESRYFDVFIEYAKAAPEDILIRITAHNRGSESAHLTLLPTLWYRNTWAWGREAGRPGLSRIGKTVIRANHPIMGQYVFAAEGAEELLFTENETNMARLYNTPNTNPYVKDAFHEYLIRGREAAVNPGHFGTKAAALYAGEIAGGGAVTLRLRLTRASGETPALPEFSDFEEVFAARAAEADAFYEAIEPVSLSADHRAIQRQALAGMLWTKQYYNYDVGQWLEGDPTQLPPPPARKRGRNREWTHLNNGDVISMPDTWEYPWYASWDTAFHCLPLALVDPTYAKSQLSLLVYEWYQHPNGQIPAYEWNFSDVNPPVIAWATWRIYKIDQKQYGKSDRLFLETMFHKLLLNFTWWVNRKDSEGNNVFQGGFLGLDNIGVFDRSAPLPTGGKIEQCDGTSWMGMFCLNMLTIALELAKDNPAYENIATKFFEHFLYIAWAMNHVAGTNITLWDEDDQFFYDVLHLPNGETLPLKVRSLVGLIPLFAVETIEPELLERLPNFKGRLEWFLTNRPRLASLVSRWYEPGAGERRLLALVRGTRLKKLLRRALDPAEFLSDYGIRSLSRHHAENPYVLNMGGNAYSVRYEPAESNSRIFGGNSNWRGPLWFPINYLLIESLQKFHHYYSDDFLVECPTGSGVQRNLNQIADELSQRLIRIFARDDQGRRPFNGDQAWLAEDAHWRDLLLFHEYFHGDSGAGLGASHQTGWTGLIAKLIQQQGRQMDKGIS